MYSVLPQQYDTASLRTVMGEQVDHFQFFRDMGEGEEGQWKNSLTTYPQPQTLTCSTDV